NLDMARQIGADQVIDYTKEDFTKNGQHYDLIIGANGNRSLSDYRRALTPTGIYVVAGGSISQVMQGWLLGPPVSGCRGPKMGSRGITKIKHKDLVFMKELLEAGKVVPVIDRCYPLSETPEAIRYAVEEHPKGKVVISVEHSNSN